MTVASNATLTQQQRRVEFAYNGGTLPAGGAYLTGVKDPKGNTTRITYGAVQPLAELLEPLLGSLGLLENRRKVSAVADRASTSTQPRETSYTYADPVENQNATTPADQRTRLTEIENARGIVDEVKTDGLGRMLSLTEGTTSPVTPVEPARKTEQGWTADNYVAHSTVGAGEANQAVTTENTWGPLGQLTKQIEHGGTAGSNTAPSASSRTRTWQYRSHAGTVRNPNDSRPESERNDPLTGDEGGAFVYDVTQETDWRGKPTVFDYGPMERQDRGNVETLVTPAASYQQFSYNTRGLQTGVAQNYWYTLGQRPVFNQSEANMGVKIFAGFDGNGDPTAQRDERDFLSFSGQDEVGNLQWSADPRAGVAFGIDGPEASAVSSATPVAEVARVRDDAREGTASLAHVTRMSYDALDREITRAVPKNSTENVEDRFIITAREYDKNDNEVKWLDGAGKITDRSYTATDQIDTESTAEVAHHNPGSSRDAPTTVATTAAAREVAEYRYDRVDNLAERADPLGDLGSGGHRTTWSYNAFDEPVTQIRISGAGRSDSTVLATSRDYDARGNVVGEADAKSNGDLTGTLQAYEETAATNARTPQKQRWQYQYDVFDRLKVSEENPVGGAADEAGRDVGLDTHYDYDTADNLTKKTTPAGRVTEYSYDDANRLIETRAPFKYDQVSQTTDTDRLDMAVTTIKRRGDGRPYEMTAPRGNDDDGQNGFVTRFSFHDTGELRARQLPRVTGQYGPDWRVSYAVNQVGDPVSVTDARGKPITNTFLDTGELASTTRPSWFIYDQNSAGIRERTDEDPRPKPASESDIPTGQGHGDFGKVAPQKLPEVLPAAGKTSLSYDDELRLAKVSSRRDSYNPNDPNDDDLTYDQTFTYDAVGRLTGRSIPFTETSKIDLSWQHDAAGNVRAELDGRGAATIYDYDDFDRLRSSSQPRNCTDSTTNNNDPTCARPQTSQTYDLNSNITERTLPAATDVNVDGQGTTGTETKNYDDVDRPVIQTDAANAKTKTEYDPDGFAIRVLRPQAFMPGPKLPEERYATVLERDGAGRVTKTTEKVTDTPADGTPGGGTPVSQDLITDVTYDRNGNATKVEAPAARKEAGGDLLRRVQSSRYDGRDLPYSTTVGTGSDARSTVTEYDGNGWLRRTVKPKGVDTTNASDPEPFHEDNLDPDAEPGGPQSRNAETLEYTPDGLLRARNLPWGDGDGNTGATGSNRYRQTFQYTDRGVLRRVSGVFNDGTGGGEGTAPHATEIDVNAAGWPTSTTSKDKDHPAQDVQMAFSYDQQGNQLSWRSDSGARSVRTNYFASGLLRSRCGVRLTGTGDDDVDEEQIYSFRYDRSGALSRTIDWAHHRIGDNTRCVEAENDANAGPYVANGDPRTTNITRDRAGRPLKVNETWDAGRDTAYAYIAGTPNLIAGIKTDGKINGPSYDDYVDGTRMKFAYDEKDRNTTVSAYTDSADTGIPDRRTDLRWWPSGDQRELAKPKVNSTGARTIEQRFYSTTGDISRRKTVSADTQDDRTTEYAYDENGNRTKDDRGDSDYNPRNQLTHWERKRRGTGDPSKNDPAKTIDYTLDGAGRQISKTEQIVIDETGDTYGNITTQIRTDNTYAGDRLKKSARSIKVTNIENLGNGSAPADKHETDCFRYGAMGSMTLSVRKNTEDANCQPTPQADPQAGWRTENQNTYDTFERLVASRQREYPTGTPDGVLPDNQAYCYDGFDRRDRRLTNISSTQNPSEGDDNQTAFQKARAACTQATTTTGINVYDYSYVGLTEQLTRERRPEATQTYEYTANGLRLGRLERTSTPEWRSYETDAQGTVLGLESSTDGTTKPQGGKLNTYDIDPYGDPTVPETALSDDAKLNPFRFQGFYKDQATGNYDMQARSYRPSIGQFLQQDRFANPQADLALASDPLTSSRYAFTAGNPATRAELDGHGFLEDRLAEATGTAFPTTDSCPPTSNECPGYNAGKGSGGGGKNNDTPSSPSGGGGGGGSRPAPTPSASASAQATAAERNYVAPAPVYIPPPPPPPAKAAPSLGSRLLGGLKDFGIGAGSALKETGELVGDLATDPGETISGVVEGWNAIRKDPSILLDVCSDTKNAAQCFSKNVTGLVLGGGAAKAATLSRLAPRGPHGTKGTARCSFGAATPILMADGTLKPISRVRTGDYVLATDPETGERRASRVSDVWAHRDRMFFFGFAGETIESTENHPFWDDRQQAWVPAASLSAGGRLLTADGETARVGAGEIQAERVGWAYNLTVSGLSTYHVGRGRFLVHNACSRSSGETSAAEYGRKRHKSEVYPPGYEREFRLQNGKVADAVDLEGRHVIELKPNNARAVRRGLKQARRYAEQLELETGEPFSYGVRTYDRD